MHSAILSWAPAHLAQAVSHFLLAAQPSCQGSVLHLTKLNRMLEEIIKQGIQGSLQNLSAGGAYAACCFAGRSAS